MDIERLKWLKVAELVERIISTRTVTRTADIQHGATMRRVTVTRPFRFREFATEIGVDNAAAWRWIRGGVEPEPANRKAVEKWIKKNFTPSKKPKTK